MHYDNQSGYVLAKVIETPDSMQTGLSYYYYNNNEAMSGVQEFQNGKPVGDGFVFYDGMNRIKKFVRYDSLSKLVFEKSYSIIGEKIEN